MTESRAFKTHNIFTNLLSRRTAAQHTRSAKDAVNWFRGKITREHPKVNRSELLRTPQVKHHTPMKGLESGHLYLYNYDPKWKAELDVYDTYPCVIPFRVEKDRFWGINFHYLPYKQRAQLLDLLYNITNNKRFDETTKFKITYQVLQKIAKKSLYEDTIHCYLKRKVKSRMLYVLPEEWPIAISLPIARMKGPKAQQYTF